MKKVLTVLMAVVLVVAMASMTVGARTLTNEEKALFQKLRESVAVSDGEFHLDEAAVVQGENWLMQQTFQLTPAQISAIEAEFKAAQGDVVAAGSGDTAKWSQATRSSVLTHIDNAAQQLGLHATGHSGTLKKQTTSEATPTIAGISILDNTNATVVKSNFLIGDTGFGAEAMIIAGVSVIAILGTCVIISKKVELF